MWKAMGETKSGYDFVEQNNRFYSIFLAHWIVLFNRAKYWIRVGGIGKLAYRCLLYLVSPIFQFRKNYLFYSTLNEINPEVKSSEKVKDLEFRIILRPDDISLISQSGYDLKKYMRTAQFMSNANKRLESGAILFCIFSKYQTISSGWAYLSKQAANSTTAGLYNVDYPKEAFWGDIYTVPEYRGLGIMPYLFHKAQIFLKKKNISILKESIVQDNGPSLKVAQKTGWKLYGEKHFYKFLFWYVSTKEQVYKLA